MRTLIIKIAIVLGVIVSLVYLYLVLAVNTKIKEQEKFGKNQPDSVKINDSTYDLQKLDSVKRLH
jgi:hypothetical protein